MTYPWQCPRCGKRTYAFLHSCPLANVRDEVVHLLHCCDDCETPGHPLVWEGDNA